VTFDHVVADLRGVARRELIGDASLPADGRELCIGNVIGFDLEAVLLEVLDPGAAAPSSGRLVDDDGGP